jgi:short-subunit dehydrogenase
MTDVSKPLALVTGASSGIGLELARQFAEHGYDLLVTAEDDAIVGAAEELRTQADVQALQTDLRTYDGVERLYQAAVAAGRPVAAVAINAGIGVGGPFAQTDLAAELDLIHLNVCSSVHLAKRMVVDMAARGEGDVLITASIASTMPAPYQAVYGASKAFLYQFSEALRYELKDSGVNVTALMPGPTDTDFFHRADMEDTRVATGPKDDPAEVARQGFKAMTKGRDHVVAGSMKVKAQGPLSKVSPDRVKAAMHAKLSEPGSGH